MHGWVFEGNLKSFAGLLAFIAGYSLYDEDYDWLAIEYGIKETNHNLDKWYSYPLQGAHALTLEVARNIGSAVVNVRVTSSEDILPELAAQFELLITICQDYNLVRRNRHYPL